MVTSTPIGAAYLAMPSVPDRALAVARAVSESMPKSRERNPGAFFRAVTLTVSLATTELENSTSCETTPPSLRLP